MLSKAKLKARESGAIVRNSPIQRYYVNDTSRVIALPYSIEQNKYAKTAFFIGQYRFLVTEIPRGQKPGRVTGHCPASWFVDLSADVENDDLEDACA